MFGGKEITKNPEVGISETYSRLLKLCVTYPFSIYAIYYYAQKWCQLIE